MVSPNWLVLSFSDIEILIQKGLDQVESQNDRKIPNQHAHLSFNLLLPDLCRG